VDKRRSKGINGTWLSPSSAPSLFILSGLMYSSFPFHITGSYLFALYLPGRLHALYYHHYFIFYRFMFFEFRPRTSAIPTGHMGAVAITTLAGTVLIMNAPGYAF